MLDLKFILQNPDLIQYACDKKQIKDFNIKDLISTNTRRVELLKDVENLRAEQNNASEKIASGTLDSIGRESLIARMKTLKEELGGKEESLKIVMAEWQKQMLSVPNIPDMTVPEGKDDSENVEIKNWGKEKIENKKDFELKDHIEIMENLGILDLERGVKVHGFRGYFIKGLGVNLTLAIWQYALDFWSQKGYTPVIAPAISRKNSFFATGYLPQSEDDLYKTQDGDYLVGTAEVSLMGMHTDEVLENLENNPIKYLGFSPCYRREAGAHSKDVKGLIRVHEFYKWEQILLCEANHQVSVNLHEEINRNTEEFIESLGIPYRTVVNCGGDLGLGQVKKYDIELWVPKEEKYREISSASYFHDFQTRRGNIKYKDKNGGTRFAHSLNCTAIPTPRILVSLVENFQNQDGSVTIPAVLRKYMNNLEKIKIN